MIEELTTAQIAARIGVSERSVQRYISQNKLPARPLTRNRYAIDSDEIDALILPEHHNQETRIEAMERQIGELQELPGQIKLLTERIAILEEQLAKTTVTTEKTEMTTVTTTPKVLTSAPAEYKASTSNQDVLSARSFAESHGVSRDRITSMIEKAAFETTPTKYGQRIQHMLTNEQQRAVIAYWQANNITYTPCAQCPH